MAVVKKTNLLETQDETLQVLSLQWLEFSWIADPIRAIVAQLLFFFNQRGCQPVPLQASTDLGKNTFARNLEMGLSGIVEGFPLQLQTFISCWRKLLSKQLDVDLFP